MGDCASFAKFFFENDNIAYSFNPYDTSCSIVLHKAPSTLPAGTLHSKLEGLVSFVPYPTTHFAAPLPAVPKEGMVRMFIGQLPYQVTDMQLEWLCYTFGHGGAVYFSERIMKWDESRGAKIPSGCIHAYGDPDIMNGLILGMHKRILVDDTGVWYAQTPEETEILNSYCHELKVDKRLRFQNRPYDTVVVQYATSSYGTHAPRTPPRKFIPMF